MKRSYFLIAVFLILIVTGYGQGIDFFTGHWKEALEIAQKEDKIIFVDAYAEWCGPCKMMARTVFVDEEVGDFYNKNFINMQIDMEKGQGLEFGQSYPVSAYPTLYYLKPNGEIIHKEVGAKDARSFVQIGQLAIRNYDRSAEFAKKYEEGNRDYELVLDYVKALIREDKPSLKVSNDYLSSNPPISEKQKAVFVFESLIEADSRLFDMTVGNKEILSDVYSEDEINNKIKFACYKTLEKAIEFESYMLVEEAKSKVDKHLSSGVDAFKLEADMIYSQGIGDIPAYVRNLDTYCKNIIDDNPKELHDFALELMKQYKDKKEAMELSESICKKAVEIEENPEYLVTYSKILITNGKIEKALETAQRARDIIRLEGKPTRQIEGLIRYLESL